MLSIYVLILQNCGSKMAVDCCLYMLRLTRIMPGHAWCFWGRKKKSIQVNCIDLINSWKNMFVRSKYFVSTRLWWIRCIGRWSYACDCFPRYETVESVYYHKIVQSTWYGLHFIVMIFSSTKLKARGLTRIPHQCVQIWCHQMIGCVIG